MGLIPLYDLHDGAGKREIGDQIDRHLDVLEGQVLSGKPESAQLAFRLKSITDGAVSSSVNIILGKYIHVDPEHFLELLFEHDHLTALRKIYGNYGLDLVDDWDGQLDETRARIRSLQTVSKNGLVGTRDRAIRDLEKLDEDLLWVMANYEVG